MAARGAEMGRRTVGALERFDKRGLATAIPVPPADEAERTATTPDCHLGNCALCCQFDLGVL